jgi:glyceraldehyde 3-phosphate dehydrogenase
LPWQSLSVDVVIESTGRFRSMEGASAHLKAGAKKVVISAPAGDDIPTYLIGINDQKYANEAIINNASCTTNCVAPVVAIIQSRFGVIKAAMTTIHGYTTEQNLQDGPPPGLHSSELRRGRAAAENIVPASTGAAIATTRVIPELLGKFDGLALRVPIAVGSISDFTFLVAKKTSADEVNQAFKEMSGSPIYKAVLAVTEEALVSKDVVGRPESAIVDLTLTQVIDGDLVKVFVWYDNEYGYSHRLIEQVINIGEHVTV